MMEETKDTIRDSRRTIDVPVDEENESWIKVK